MSINLQPTVTLTTNRCRDCGCWWALEAGWGGTCPKCAYRRAAERNTRLEKLERSIRSLRGALTKAQRRGGK